MEKLSISLFFTAAMLLSNAQTDSLTKAKFVIGLSAPELLHVGVGLDITRFNQLGVSVGIGPTWGGVWPSLNAEHRLYFGNINEFTNRRKWFFKQGITYFSADRDKAVTFTIGTDLKSRARHRGWTIDAGAFILYQKASDLENRIGPAIRFQYFSYFKKEDK